MLDVHVATYPTKLGEFPIYPTYQVATMGAPKSSRLSAWECYERVYRQWHSHHFVMNMINISFTRIQSVQVFNGKAQQMVDVPSVFPKKKSLLLFSMAVYSPASNLKKANSCIGLHPNFWNLLNLIKWQVRATNFEKIHLVFSCNSRKFGNFKHIWVYQVSTDPFQKPTSTAGKHHLH